MPLSKRYGIGGRGRSQPAQERLEIKPNVKQGVKARWRSKEVRVELAELRRMMRTMGEIGKALGEHVST
jgi:hypothetical protein